MLGTEGAGDRQVSSAKPAPKGPQQPGGQHGVRWAGGVWQEAPRARTEGKGASAKDKPVSSPGLWSRSVTHRRRWGCGSSTEPVPPSYSSRKPVSV